MAKQEVEAGAQLLISGDLGIGNTTPAAALVAAGLGVPADEVVGRGTGIDDTMLEHKTTIIRDALARAGDSTSDPIATLAALGSADLAASTGYLLTAARLRVPALLGLMAVACALTADRIGSGAAAWFASGHRSTEPAQSLALDKLGLEPLLALDMRLGEGSGAVAAVPVCAAPQRPSRTRRYSKTCFRGESTRRHSGKSAGLLAARRRNPDRSSDGSASARRRRHRPKGHPPRTGGSGTARNGSDRDRVARSGAGIALARHSVSRDRRPCDG